MKRIIKHIIILGIIVLAIIFIINRNESDFTGPNPEELSGIIFIDVIGEKAIQKTKLINSFT